MLYRRDSLLAKQVKAWERQERLRDKIHTSGYEGRMFACYFHFIGFHHVSLGAHIALEVPNIEIHTPGGFLRFGFAGPEYRTGQIKPRGWMWKYSFRRWAEESRK